MINRILLSTLLATSLNICLATSSISSQPIMTITSTNSPAQEKALQNTLTPMSPSSSVIVSNTNSSASQPITKKKKRTQSTIHSLPVTPTISSMRFDFSYHGNVSNLISKLKEYDPAIHELPALGTKEAFDFNVDLSNTSITEIASSLNNQTDGKVNLIYEPAHNNARLVFSSKITKKDFANDVISESKKLNNTTKLKLIPGLDGVIKMPFGGPYPVVCKPLRMCDIRLEQGEVVRGWTLSDKENWILPGASSPQFLYSGPDGNTVPHVVLKPAEAGLDSNLIITTNKRTYNIPLQSSKDNYVTAIAFYYPEEVNQGLIDQRSEMRQQAENQGEIPLGNPRADDPSNFRQPLTFTNDAPNQSVVPISALNFNYEVSGDDVDWKPVQVFDDGTHVWIKFAQNRQEYPPLFEVDADGVEKALLIYQPMPGGYYRVDSLFKKAALIIGDGTDYEKKIVISKLTPQKPWYKRIFGSNNES